MGRPVSEILAGGGFGGLGGGKGGNDGKASEGQPLRFSRLDRIELTSSLPFYPQPKPSTSGSKILPLMKLRLYVHSHRVRSRTRADLTRLSGLQEEMAAASLDQNFTEELSAIEQCM
jgi:hypothetical protein